MYGFRNHGFGAIPTSATAQAAGVANPTNPTPYGNPIPGTSSVSTLIGPVDCSSYFNWVVQPDCWQYSPGAWSQMAAFPASLQPGPLAKGATAPVLEPTTTTTLTPAESAMAPADLVAQQIAQQTAINQQITLEASQGIQPVPCSQNFAFSSTLGVCDSTVVLVGGLVGVVALLAFLVKR